MAQRSKSKVRTGLAVLYEVRDATGLDSKALGDAVSSLAGKRGIGSAGIASLIISLFEHYKTLAALSGALMSEAKPVPHSAGAPDLSAG
jgi:hypothetical protein